jgi:hypothetical protein
LNFDFKLPDLIKLKVLVKAFSTSGNLSFSSSLSKSAAYVIFGWNEFLILFVEDGFLIGGRLLFFSLLTIF